MKQSFHMLLFILIFSLLDTFSAFPQPDTPELSEGAGTAISVINNNNYGNEKGYECGNIFYSDAEINKALSFGLTFVDENLHHPQRYFGPLYGDSSTTEYFLWPIKKGQKTYPSIKYPHTSHSIVFTRSGERVVDVIAKIVNLDFTKCIKRYDSQAEPSTSVPEVTNGYQCGYEFLSDELIEQSVSIAREMIGKENHYPIPYGGSLYPKDKGYLLWPILTRRKIYTFGKSDLKPYFLVIDSRRQLLDIVVKGYSDNYLRCFRSREFSQTSVFDPYKEFSVPPPEAGYQCGSIFFDIKALNFAANLAKNKFELMSIRRLPTKYDGHPFYEPCLLWPILNDGSLMKKGYRGPYRLVLDTKFVIKGVVIVSGEDMKVCDKKLMKAKINHDRSDYVCRNTVFPNQVLVNAAEIACNRMKTRAQGNFPARYEGPRFVKDGPYHTYPILQDKAYNKKPGAHRVVINTYCEVVGALTATKHAFYRRFIKCRRVDDGPLFINVNDNPNEPITEHYLKYRKDRG